MKKVLLMVALTGLLAACGPKAEDPTTTPPPATDTNAVSTNK